MDITGITVCINYSDLLNLTLKHNRHYFKDYYIGTLRTDQDTIQLANQYKCTIAFCDELVNIHNSKFNKSGIIHNLQAHAHQTHPNDWILIHDADCLIYLEKQELDKQKLYGATRLNYHTQSDYKEAKYFKHQIHGAGYFQLYHMKSHLYDSWSPDCGFCDLGFKKLYGNNYELLQTARVEHLGPSFINWQGRRSPYWTLS